MAAALCSVLANAAHAAPLNWFDGYLTPGTGARFPLVLEPRGGAQGAWALSPLRAPLKLHWTAQRQPPAWATLVPGQPLRVGPSTRVPVAVQTTLQAPAVAQLVSPQGPYGLPLAVHPGLPAPTPLRAGNRFLRVGGGGRYQQRGRPLPFPALTGRLLTLTRLEPGRAVFTVPGLGEVVRLGTPAPDGTFADLAPLIRDPALLSLKTRYEGKTVWAYGGLSTTCEPQPDQAIGLGAGFDTPLKLVTLARLGRPLALNAQGGWASDAGRGADVLALTPLVALIETRPLQATGTFSLTGVDDDPATLSRTLDQLSRTPGEGQCGDLTPILLPDTWAVERVFSLAAPSAAVPRGELQTVLGMTRWQYAWRFGFPDASFGRRAELLRQSAWRYRNIPFEATVTFDAAGKVKALDVPRLP